LPTYCSARTLKVYMRLPSSIEKRLETLALRTGRSKTHHIRIAILKYLDDLEDVYEAEQTLKRILDNKEPTIPLREVITRHGLKG
jgi:RHH-type transcriptional regulator, rel operon repressor / antitoxin RelB